MIGAAWSLNSSMATQKFCWIVCNRASISLLFTCISIVEDHWSFAQPESSKFQSCTSRGLFFDFLNSLNCWYILVDLLMVMILHFESSDFVHNWVRSMRLKFWWWNLFPSIRVCLCVYWWNVGWLLMYNARSTYYCVQF